MRALAAFRNDVRLHWRQGFYAAYLLVGAAAVVLLRQLPPELRAFLLPVIVVWDQAVFASAIATVLLLYERDDGTLRSLLTAPLRPAEFLIARTASVTLLCTGGASLIAVGAVGLNIQATPYVAGAALTAAFFALLGTAALCRLRDVRRVGLLGVALMAALSPPLFAYFDVIASPWLAALPTHAAQQLLAAGFLPVPRAELAMAVIVLVTPTVIAFLIALRALRTFVLAWDEVE